MEKFASQRCFNGVAIKLNNDQKVAKVRVTAVIRGQEPKEKREREAYGSRGVLPSN